MEQTILTMFLCFVALVALGQAAYACPRHENAEKLYASPAKRSRAAAASDVSDTGDVVLTLISVGAEEYEASTLETKIIRRAA